MASYAHFVKMLAAQSHLSSAQARAPIIFPPVASSIPRSRPPNLSFSALGSPIPAPPALRSSPPMASASAVPSGDRPRTPEQGQEEDELGRLAEVASRAADAAGEVIRRYFRKKFEILDKEDLSPVTIADQAAEEAMVSIILGSFPAHAIYGEEKGWRCKEKSADYVWVLDPIDGTKSFITGKPLFGTLIALLHKGKPILGIIDQPVLKERWVGMMGKRTTLNGEELSTRPCTNISQAYLYTTSPHLFKKETEEAFGRVRSKYTQTYVVIEENHSFGKVLILRKVKVPLYGCDCYAYALLASGFVDLVIESGLKPYDFLALIPVIEGSGGIITDWKGHQLYWEPSPDSHAQGFNVLAAGDKQVHQQALDLLHWQ